jgi:hypothetical protein
MRQLRQWLQKLINHQAKSNNHPDLIEFGTIIAPTERQVQAVEKAINNVFETEYYALAAVILREPCGLVEQMLSPFIQLMCGMRRSLTLWCFKFIRTGFTPPNFYR